MQYIDELNPFFSDYDDFILKYEEILKTADQQKLAAKKLFNRQTLYPQFLSENSPLLQAIIIFLQKYFLDSKIDKSLVTQNEILISLIAACELRENQDIQDIARQIYEASQKQQF